MELVVVELVEVVEVVEVGEMVEVVEVAGLRLVVVEVVEEEEVTLRVEVVVRLREVMRVVVLVGDCPGLTDVVVLELVVVLFVLCVEIWLFNLESASVGDFDLQLK
jgi:hypothetical protein